MIHLKFRRCLKIVKRNVIQKFLLPDLGEKIKEVTIKKWHVKEGDKVSEYDTLVDVATDKLFTELPSPFNGRILKLLYHEEDTCQVGDVLIEIDTETGTIDSILQSEIHDIELDLKNNNNKKEQILEGNLKVLAAPTVRHFAKSNNIDISKVSGSENKGRITKEDVIKYMNDLTPKTTIKPIENLKKEDKLMINKNLMTEVEMNLFEKGMVKSMNYSTSVPLLNLHEEFNVTKLIKLKNEFNTILNKRVSIFAFFVKSFSLALLEIPKMNSNYNPEKNEFKYTINNFHNISIAIDSKNGLAAPNIKNVQNLSIEEIDIEIKKLVDSVNEGKLTAIQLEGGTIGLSNIGSIGGIFATPLALPLQTSIVALGKVRKTPFWNGTEFVPIDSLPVSFAADHRILDGATVARFAMIWKKYVENPSILLSKLK